MYTPLLSPIQACSKYGRGEMYTRLWWGNMRADPGVDGRIILKWNYRKRDVAHGLDRYGSGQGLVTGTCKCGNEWHFGFLKMRGFLD